MSPPRPSSPSVPRSTGGSAARPTSPSGKTYSSGGPPATTRPTPPPSSPPPISSPSGKSYTPGSGGLAGRQPTAPGRLSGGAFDASAAAAQRRAESRKAYTAGKAPKPTYRPPGAAQPRPIDTADRRVTELRRQLDRERWVNRELRLRTYYAPYYGYPVVIYHDPYSSFFWWWLLAQSLDTRAHWAYHHRDVMDDARYRDLLRRDAQLEARVRELEAKQLPRNPAQVPPALEKDPDAMYTDEYVDAVFNPQPTDAGTPPTPPPTMPRTMPTAHGMTAGAFFWAGVRFLLKAAILLAVMAGLIWLVFFKRWGGS
ncbi:MAG: hypothetical protein U0736_06500 [Gemmataceae bacterium]